MKMLMMAATVILGFGQNTQAATWSWSEGEALTEVILRWTREDGAPEAYWLERGADLLLYQAGSVEGANSCEAISAFLKLAMENHRKNDHLRKPDPAVMVGGRPNCSSRDIR